MYKGPVKSVDDVKAFFSYLIKTESISFHPDEDFRNYVSTETGEATLSDETADRYDNLMNEAFDVCEKAGEDIYALAMANLKTAISS